MPYVSATVSTRDVEDMFALAREYTEKEIATILNRSVRRARTQATNRIAQEFAIKPRALVAKRMKVKAAKKGKLMATLSLLVRPISAARLEGIAQVAGGVTALTQSFPGAFLAKGLFSKGFKHVFRRKPEARAKKVERPNWKGTRKPRSFRRGFTKRNTHSSQQPVEKVAIDIRNRGRMLLEIEAERAAEYYVAKLAEGIMEAAAKSHG